MGWWFGRKSAPADVRPFVPTWLNRAIEEEGVARTAEGAMVYMKAEAQCACYRSGAWEFGVLRGSSLVLDGMQVVGQQGTSIASASGGTTVDTEARAAIDQILAAMRAHGLIAS